MNKKNKHLGRYNTIEEAKKVYDKAFEELINQVIKDYKNKIPEKIYKNLLEALGRK